MAEISLISVHDILVGRIQRRDQAKEVSDRVGDEFVRQRDIDTSRQTAREARIRRERQAADEANADFQALVREQITSGDIERRRLNRLDNADNGDPLPRGSLIDIFA